MCRNKEIGDFDESLKIPEKGIFFETIYGYYRIRQDKDYLIIDEFLFDEIEDDGTGWWEEIGRVDMVF